MVWIPSDQSRPHILRFEFKGGQLQFVVHTSSCSPEEALADYGETRGEFMETGLLVSARKGKHTHPVSHKLAHLERDHPGVPFIATMEARTYQKMCNAADKEWERDKEARRAEIRRLNHDTRSANIADLPVGLSGRIIISDTGCWLWRPLRVRNGKGALKANKKVFLQEYGRVSFKGQKWAAHRLVYTLLVGEIPHRTWIRHYECDTPACVNPAHFLLGIEEDNFRDMVRKKRAAWQVARKRRAHRVTALICAAKS